MSSDVYIDIGNEKNEETMWVGILGILQGSYLYLDLLEALRILCIASNHIVTPWLGQAAENVLLEFLQRWETAKNDTNEQFVLQTGFDKPIDFEDSVPSPGMFLECFSPKNYGKPWSVRVD